MGIRAANMSNPVDIAVSGLKAENLRLKVTASNIANARTSRTDSGAAYRRKFVVLETGGKGLGGVKIDEIAQDMTSEFRKVLMPGHEDADEQGYVLMPNVDLPVEMTEMVMASRAYQANAAVLKRYQEMVDMTIELLR